MSEIENDPIGQIRTAMINSGLFHKTIDKLIANIPDFFKQPLMPAVDQNGLLDLVRDMRKSQREFDRTSSDAALTQKHSYERQVDAALRKVA